MTKREIGEAIALAQSDIELPGMQDGALAIFDGFGLPDFRPVYVSLEAVASLIRYQTFYLGDGIDNEALNEIAQCGRKQFMVLSPE